MLHSRARGQRTPHTEAASAPLRIYDNALTTRREHLERALGASTWRERERVISSRPHRQVSYRCCGVALHTQHCDSARAYWALAPPKPRHAVARKHAAGPLPREQERTAPCRDQCCTRRPLITVSFHRGARPRERKKQSARRSFPPSLVPGKVIHVERRSALKCWEILEGREGGPRIARLHA